MNSTAATIPVITGIFIISALLGPDPLRPSLIFVLWSWVFYAEKTWAGLNNDIVELLGTSQIFLTTHIMPDLQYPFIGHDIT